MSSRRSARAARRPRANQSVSSHRACFERLEDRCLLAVGAELVKDINTVSSASSSPANLVDVGGVLFVSFVEEKESDDAQGRLELT